jgi:hypothetical protein
MEIASLSLEKEQATVATFLKVVMVRCCCCEDARGRFSI